MADNNQQSDTNTTMPTRKGCSMRILAITILGLLSIGTITAQETSTTDSLESQRVAAEESWQKATDEARQIAAAYREAAAAESPDEQSIEKLKSDLEATVTKAFKSQTQLQAIRLQLAEENLQRVRAKLQRREKLSASIITRRVERMQGMEVVQSDDARNLHHFESPEALFAEWNLCYILGDAEGLVALLDDNAVNEYAATLLVFASHFGSDYSDQVETNPYKKAVSILLQTQRRPGPSNEASAAEALIFQQLHPRGPGDNVANNTRERMVAAAGVLDDPRRFCSEFLTIVFPVVRESVLVDNSVPPWQIDVGGDTATGTTRSDFYGTSSTFEANHHHSGWLIHTVFAAPLRHKSTQPELQTLHYSETPEALMAEWVRCSDGNNVADLVPLMDDNAASEFAAVMLFATASMSTVWNSP